MLHLKEKILNLWFNFWVKLFFQHTQYFLWWQCHIVIYFAPNVDSDVFDKYMQKKKTICFPNQDLTLTV